MPNRNPKLPTNLVALFLAKPKSINVLVVSSIKEIKDEITAKASARKKRGVKNVLIKKLEDKFEQRSCK